MKIRIVVASLAALITLVLPGCGEGIAKSTASQQAESTAPLPVEVAMPRIADIYAVYDTTAAIGADAEAGVVARVAGEVVEILVEEGDKVRKGQLLARLDGERLRLEMLQAKAMLEMTTREYERSSRLRERGLISASAVEALKFDMDALRASYEMKRLAYDYTSIRATIAGVVASRDIKLGWRVNAGDPAFKIADTSQLVADLHIPQSELAKFSAGIGAVIEVDAIPGRSFDATVARISPTVDTQKGTFRATVYIDNPDGLLAPGMFGRFHVAYEKHAAALVIPSVALLREDNQDVVYVVQDGTAHRNRVRVGIETGGMTEIVDGLAGTHPIVVTGHGSLRDSSKVFEAEPLNLSWRRPEPVHSALTGTDASSGG